MLIESFLRYIQYEKNFSSHTVLSYKNDLFSFKGFVEELQAVAPKHSEENEPEPLYDVERVGGDASWSVEAVDRNTIRAFVVSLAEAENSPRTIARKVSALRSFFRYLEREGVVESNPTATVQLPKVRKTLPSYLKEGEMDRLLDGVDFGEGFRAQRDRLILMMLYTTGMRRAELIALRDADVDKAAHLIRVYGKRRKERLIPYAEELAVEIKHYLEAREREVGGITDTLFVRETGEPLYPKLVHRVVTTRLGEVSTLTHRSPHVLRHTFASVMLNNGAQLNSVKELLGHSSLASTEVYTHITFEELKKSYNQAHPRATKKGGHHGH